MPARAPFTALCQLAARGPRAGRADLHLHTTFSDGLYTPAQIVNLARRCGLSALAVTDHDTVGGILPARAAAAGADLEIVAGVEITSEFRGKEIHLLAYFFDGACPHLAGALATIQQRRVERFHEMTERLRRCGVTLEGLEAPGEAEALGRRHLAELLVKAGRVGSVREAFARWLGDGKAADAPKQRLPAAEALALVQRAGGTASWAHPPPNCDRDALAALRGLGLGAIEVEYPERKRARTQELRSWANALGLAISGGSDCHGPGRRSVGCCTISKEELESLRERAARGAEPKR